MKHTHKLDLSNVKLECVRAKGELERDRDTLQCQVEGNHLAFLSFTFSVPVLQ